MGHESRDNSIPYERRSRRSIDAEHLRMRRRQVRSLLIRVVVLNGLGLSACAGFALVLFWYWRQTQVDVQNSLASRLVSLVGLFAPFVLFWILALLAVGKLFRIILMFGRARGD